MGVFKIKELKLNQRAMKSEMEKVDKNDSINRDRDKITDLWTEDEKNYKVECLKKTIEDLQHFKSNHNGKLSDIEEKMKNIKDSIHKVLEMSHKILKSMTKTMNTMVEKLENSYQVRTMVYIDADKEESQVEGGV